MVPKTAVPGRLHSPLIQAHQGTNASSFFRLMAATGVKRGLQKCSAPPERCDFVVAVVVDGVFLLMDGANCGGRESEVAGPGAAELVKEWLNTHLHLQRGFFQRSGARPQPLSSPCRRTRARAHPAAHPYPPKGAFSFPPVRF